MRRNRLTFIGTVFINILIQTKAVCQLEISKPTSLDSLNISVSKKIMVLLEQQRVQTAISFFRFKSKFDSTKIYKQLKKASKDIQVFKTKTNRLVQTSFKDYDDSLNIEQVLYYNNEGRFYLYELFFLKDDNSSKVVDLFVKDPAVLAKVRRKIAEFKRKNPDIPQPPESLPPGIYIKEHNR